MQCPRPLDVREHTCVFCRRTAPARSLPCRLSIFLTGNTSSTVFRRPPLLRCRPCPHSSASVRGPRRWLVLMWPDTACSPLTDRRSCHCCLDSSFNSCNETGGLERSCGRIELTAPSQRTIDRQREIARERENLAMASPNVRKLGDCPEKSKETPRLMLKTRPNHVNRIKTSRKWSPGERVSTAPMHRHPPRLLSPTSPDR